MLSFICQNIQMDEVIRCSFELTKTEYKILIFLIKQKETLNTNQIAKKNKLERSTAQKAISKLLKKELIERRQINLEKGGYKYLYNLKEQDEIKKKLLEIVKNWHKNVSDTIKKVDLEK